MSSKNRAPFQAALNRYHRARSRIKANTAERASDQVIRNVDQALDVLMTVPSPSLGAFGEKIRILEAEYGPEAQPRHVRAIYADVAIVLALSADALLRGWPVS